MNRVTKLCPSCHKKFDYQKNGAPKRSIGQKKMCRNGHLFTPENSYTDPRGFKGCRTCRSEAKERWKKRRDA